jgi:hypothetical protein
MVYNWITGFLDFVHHPVFYKPREHNVSVTGRKQIQFPKRCALFFRIPADGQSPKTE